MEWTVTVTRVIDGDTVEAQFPNGEIDTIRLLGVDTPETDYNSVSPGEFEGISDTTAGRDHLLNWGENATQVATDRLSGSEVRVVVDEEADRRGYYGRLLAYIYADGENFNEQLLSEGYARLYESEFSKRGTLEAAEEAARENSMGLWEFDGGTNGKSSATESDSESIEIAVATIHADADGNDHENLNDEYIIFENTGEDAINLGRWTVADAVGATYQVPTGFTLKSGDTVTLYTGSGNNSDTELYWGAERAVWNNGGDTITLKDGSGTVVLQCEYS
jgi:micrococcal nuclease